MFNREKLRRVPDGVDWDRLPDTERQVDNTPTDDTPTPPKDTPSPAFHLPIPPPRNPTGEPPADVITALATLPPADTHVLVNSHNYADQNADDSKRLTTSLQDGARKASVDV